MNQQISGGDLSKSRVALDQCNLDLPLVELEQGLIDYGVLSRDEFAAVVVELSSAGAALTTRAVAEALVRTERVSAYQLLAVASGQGQRLTVGEYTVVEPLGAGGMGEVLLAVHRRMKRQVAIKFLPARFADDVEMVRRFEREVEVAAQLTHPNIVTAFDAGEAEGTHYLVMEYVDGGDLGALIKEFGPLPRDEALKCVLQAGRGLSHAHTRGVVHRDIKPANLLLDRQGNVKVLDMGLARWSHAAAEAVASELSVTGEVMGTIDFMAPEQAASAKSADHRSDIYSLGCTLYMLASGEPVFKGKTVIERVLAHQSAEIPPFSDGADERSERLNAAFRRMLAKQPDDRFDSVDDACEALAACREHATLDIRVAVAPPVRPHRANANQDTIDQRPEHSLATTTAQAPTAEGLRSRGRQGRNLVLVGLLSLLAVAALAVPFVLKIVRPDGTLVVECFIENAIVEVDGKEMVRVTDPKTQASYRFELSQGEHRVRAVLADGTVIKSAKFEIASRDETLFQVRREPPAEPAGQAADPPHTPPKAPGGGLGPPADPPHTSPKGPAADPPPVVDDDPNVLTVAQNGSAEWKSIGAAVAAAQSGNVIRILDDASYKESIDLVRARRFQNLTIEAVGDARWKAGLFQPCILRIIHVKGVTLRNLHFEHGSMFGVLVGGSSSGCRIENCRFTPPPSGRSGRAAGLQIEGHEFVAGESPTVVSNCRFESLRNCILLQGMVMAGHRPLRTGGALIENCTLHGARYGIGLYGELHDVWVVQNQFLDCADNAVQFQHLLGEPKNVVVANNTLLATAESIRIWEDGVKQADVQMVANVSLGGVRDEWVAWDSGGDDAQGEGYGDGKAFAEAWTFTHNIREGAAPDPKASIAAGWIPPSPTDRLEEEIELLSRDPGSDDYLRPAPGSIVATGGRGGLFPSYAGAVPPAGAKSHDWRAAFQQTQAPARKE